MTGGLHKRASNPAVKKRQSKYRRDDPQVTTRLYDDWHRILNVVAALEKVAPVDILDEILAKSDLRERASRGMRKL